MTTESDRELLRAAARATGVNYDPEKSKPHPKSGAFWGLWLVINGEPTEYQRRHWNPLRDDGDALRLAVKLCIDIKPPRTEDDDAQARQIEQSFGMFETQRDTDPYAATRRAIVRAAAAIGAHKEGARE